MTIRPQFSLETIPVSDGFGGKVDRRLKKISHDIPKQLLLLCEKAMAFYDQ